MPTIMIVDDQEINRKAVGALLERDGIRIIEADDGSSALELARQELPDLAVVDLLMPEVDGFELAYRMRSEGGALARIPIIFISALYLAEEGTELAQICGVRRLLTRDTSSCEILEAVHEALTTPQPEVTVPPWGEFRMELLRLHTSKLLEKMRTVIPALAELGRDMSRWDPRD